MQWQSNLFYFAALSQDGIEIVRAFSSTHPVCNLVSDHVVGVSGDGAKTTVLLLHSFLHTLERLHPAAPLDLRCHLVREVERARTEIIPMVEEEISNTKISSSEGWSEQR